MSISARKLQADIFRFDLDWENRAITENTPQSEVEKIYREWAMHGDAADAARDYMARNWTLEEIYAANKPYMELRFPSPTAELNFRNILFKLTWAAAFLTGACSALDVRTKKMFHCRIEGEHYRNKQGEDCTSHEDKLDESQISQVRQLGFNVTVLGECDDKLGLVDGTATIAELRTALQEKSKENPGIKMLLERYEQLSNGMKNLQTTAEIAAARKLKELRGKSKGGRKAAAIAKDERSEDEIKERKAILDEAKRLQKEWDERYPDRHKPPRDEQHSNMAAFRIVANRHIGANGKPIMSADTIGRVLRREKAKGEKRGKYDRTGKKRGKSKPRT